MTWFFAILAVLVMGAVAVVAAGRGEPMADAAPDRPPTTAPTDRRLTGADLRRVRFPLAVRGYRMADVDALLDRVARELEEQEPPQGVGPEESPGPGLGRGDRDAD